MKKLKPLFVPAIALLVALGSLVAVLALHARADRAAEAQVELVSLRSAKVEISLTPASLGLADVEPPRIRADVFRQWSEFERRLADLDSVHADSRLQDVHAAAAASRAADTELQAVMAATLADAQRTNVLPQRLVDAMVVADRPHQEVLAALQAAAERFERRTESALWQATVGSAAGLLALFVLFVFFYRRSERQSAANRRAARIDPLTGLGNRRQMLSDLSVLERRGQAATLGIYDLDGFKAYNDTFGHPAGDALLERLGTRLRDAVDGVGRAYRMGGDEFCVILREGGSEQVQRLASDALADHGEGFSIGASYGSCDLPSETRDPVEALTVADRRMYAIKGERRRGGDAAVVLANLLGDRDDGRVATLAARVAADLGMDAEAAGRTELAARLRDIGAVAIPETILHKPGPLSDAEWAFVRRHSTIGERMLLAFEDLAPVAPLVRAAHEHWDGRGYPDGRSGAEIPIGARVIAVCDAFVAMTSDRPYREAVTEQAAIAELRRCAGTQFDPEVVRIAVASIAACADPQQLSSTEPTRERESSPS